MTRKLLAVIAWAGALLATFGAAAVMPTVMGVGGIIAAVAAIAWGVATAVQDGPDDQAHEDELPFMRVDRGH